MTGPGRYLTRMLLFVVAVAALVAALFPALVHAFMANVPLNSGIVGVLLLGILYIVRQVIQLAPEARWLDTYRRNAPGLSVQRQPRLLAPLSAVLGDRQTGTRMALSAVAARSLLDSIRSRLDEGRDISRYLIGLLVFLGLLGTFWGLLETVSSIAGVIGGLGTVGGDINAFFNELKSGLQAPLGGMGTAFSSSMLGLAGSLVLGFLDLQASQAQNRFYNELEEWLAGMTKVGAGPSIGDTGETASVPAFLQALIERTADSMDTLQRAVARGEDARKGANNQLMQLTEKLSVLTDQMKAEQQLMLRLAENQMELKPILARMADAVASGGFGGDEATRSHIRNIEVYLARLVDEVSTGRQQTSDEVRSEIRLLARTIAALADEQSRAPQPAAPIAVTKPVRATRP
ncbi:MAG: flagellar motor protein MotA [Alphaproteobacteria bacterium]|nr:flagellar motor protein MotA [Alphaproteobacteria bacterium]